MGANEKLAATFHPGTTNHPSVIARNHLLDIASIWPELEARVARGGSGAGERVTGSKKNAPIPIEPHVVDVMAEIEAWLVFLVHVLRDEVTIEKPVPGPVRATLSHPWAPSGVSTPALLRQVAERVGHFTEHADEGLALAFQDEAKGHAKMALKTARPSQRRVIRLGVRCLEHGTSDQGERIPCTGMYATVLDPDVRGMADYVCEADPSHRMTPLEWQRGLKKGALDTATMDAIVRETMRAGGAG